MAETNVTATLDSAKQPKAPEALSENLAAPAVPDIPAPSGTDATDGKIVTPSNVIIGSFGEKRSEVVETEKHVAGQDDTTQEIPATGEETPPACWQAAHSPLKLESGKHEV